MNPLFLSKTYSAHRETNHSKWESGMEAAFLDALLLFPPMGRRKISYQGTPYGRNELISYYLTARYWEPFGYVPEEMCEREHYPGYKNKRLVSNNMQAMKKSFQHHPLGHFLVSSSCAIDPEGMIEHSLVRIVLGGLLPCPRPDYSYFKTIMDGELELFSEPVTGWMQCSVPSSNQPAFLVHDYIEKFSQVASEYIGALGNKVEALFPEIWARLAQRLNDFSNTQPSGFRKLAGACDVIHIQATLQLPPRDKIPHHSQFYCGIQMEIHNNELETHYWRSISIFTHPSVLGLDGETDYMDSPCEVLSVGGKSTLSVPFPQHKWYQFLSSLSSDCSFPTVTIFQELWSAPFGITTERKCRTCIIWTFEASGNPEMTWRFLTKDHVDSPYHCQKIKNVLAPGLSNMNGFGSDHSLVHQSASVQGYIEGGVDTSVTTHWQLLPALMWENQAQRSSQSHDWAG